MCKTKRGSKRRGKKGEKKKEGKREKEKLAGQQWRTKPSWFMLATDRGPSYL